ncbi:MAG: PhoH family protein [bacterium]
MSDKKSIIQSISGEKISPRTDGQATLVQSIRKNKIIFVNGPAGTGKTFIAAAMAVKSFRERRVEKIVLSRPAVEAGERLGFLPGTAEEKVEPYLQPLYDSIDSFFSFEDSKRMQQDKSIEVIPVAFMRGRTFRNAFIVIDEAQNLTPLQMKMCLTRIGEGSCMVVTADTSQRDIPGTVSGFNDALNRVSSVKEIGHVELGPADVIRSDIVRRIIEAYNRI